VSQTIGYARVSPTTAEVMLAFERHLERSPQLADHTKTAYRRQAEAYLGWWDPHQHPDAFVDQVGAEAAVKAWRRYLLAEAKQAPASVNQALAAVSLLYEVGCRIRPKVRRARGAEARRAGCADPDAGGRGTAGGRPAKRAGLCDHRATARLRSPR
jgi:hypothetical protein